MTEYAGAELGGTFAHAGVATAYQHRAPYPPEVFDVLTGLVTDQPGTVLDLGAGDGAIARPLAARVDRVDALDISAAMVDAGKRRPGGDRPNLHWIVGAAETAALGGPYGLVTAGVSLHWMRWQPTMARLARLVTPRAQLAIVEQFHSTASLAREHMSTAEAEEFDRAVERVVAPWARDDGMLELTVVATVRWGRPLAG